MKFSTAFAALTLALSTCISAAPAPYSGTTTVIKRAPTDVDNTLALLNDYNSKRDVMPVDDLVARENEIVTKVLEYIKDTNLAPGIIKYLTTDPYFSPIATNVTIALIKSGVINVGTLFKSLNDSGLAVGVIRDLINDCSFYADIYKLALNYIGNLAGRIGDILGGGGDDSSKRELAIVMSNSLEVRADNESPILTSLMESLKSSGLGTQVIRQLIVDPDFLKWGANLIQQLFEQKAITLGEVVDAIIDSGLVPELFKEFLNVSTLKTVIVNALAAAFGRCDGSTVTTAKPSTTVASTPTQTGGNNPTCKKRKRSYN